MKEGTRYIPTASACSIFLDRPSIGRVLHLSGARAHGRVLNRQRAGGDGDKSDDDGDQRHKRAEFPE